MELICQNGVNMPTFTIVRKIVSNSLTMNCIVLYCVMESVVVVVGVGCK